VEFANPDEYFAFDFAHVTVAVHELLGDALYQSVAPTVIIGNVTLAFQTSFLAPELPIPT